MESLTYDDAALFASPERAADEIRALRRKIEALETTVVTLAEVLSKTGQARLTAVEAKRLHHCIGIAEGESQIEDAEVPLLEAAVNRATRQ